jgi:hypothetical protein
MHEASERRAKIEIAELITRYATFNDTGDRADQGWRFRERRGSLNFRAPR